MNTTYTVRPYGNSQQSGYSVVMDGAVIIKSFPVTGTFTKAKEAADQLANALNSDLDPVIGKVISCDFQPYGKFTIKILAARHNMQTGNLIVSGTVTSGTERSYLCGHTHTQDITGHWRELYGVTFDELARGWCIRVAG